MKEKIIWKTPSEKTEENEQILNYLWINIKWSKIYVTQAPEGQERKKWNKKTTILTNNSKIFSILDESHKMQTLSKQWTTHKENNILNIIVKLLKTKD